MGQWPWGFFSSFGDFRWSSFCCLLEVLGCGSTISCATDLVCKGGDDGCVVNKGLEISGVVAPMMA